LATLTGLTTACGGDADRPGPLARIGAAREAVSNAKTAASAIKEMGSALQEIADDAEAGVTVEPVDFRELRDLLPEMLAGLPRTDASGEKTGLGGMNISNATASYYGETEEIEATGRQRTPYLEVKVTDLGAIRGMALMSFAAWTIVDIDKESSSGYERTITIEGHPGYENFGGRGESPYGEVQVFVAKRFLVTIEGREIEWERVRAALDQIPIGKLAGMKEVGVTRER
jgi:hypothetical protein